MRKWSFLFFVLAFMHPASALADEGADEKSLVRFTTRFLMIIVEKNGM
ncbi:hypothetical protein MUB16_18685 [Priestia sp. OVL9]|nr:hypothetical protein [Priestia sp. OVL9]